MTIMLKQVEVSDFTVFLSLVYSTIIQPFQPNSPEKWLSVLLVAHTLGHTPLRQLAISNLTNVLSASIESFTVDAITLESGWHTHI